MSGFLQSIIAGLVSGLLVALPLWRLSGKQLKRETKRVREETVRIRDLNRILARAMKDEGWIDYNEDAEGFPIGNIIRLRASVTGTSLASANAEVKRAIPPEHA